MSNAITAWEMSMINANIAAQTIADARNHLGEATMLSSAEVCLSESDKAYATGDYAVAHVWATRSLSYSVGIFHPDHRRAAAIKVTP